MAALASWIDARAAGGTWLVRIEDLDGPRVQPGAADEILRALERLRLEWDREVLYQSRRAARYQEALRKIRPHTYWCGCTRREIADSALALASDGAQIYPGTCRGGRPAGKAQRALRVRVDGSSIAFVDRVQGRRVQVLSRDVGDFVLHRADGQFAYQLAVVVDDMDQGVTDVVRGADLLDSTGRQIFLQRLLGYATPRYLHVPVALNEAGEKLSKQTGAQALDLSEPGREIARALAFLGQPGDLGEALRAWNPALIPAQVASAPAPRR